MTIIGFKVNSLFCLLSITIAGLFLRLFALNWGLPDDYPFHFASFHPDEEAGILSILQLMNKPLDATVYMYTKGSGYFYLSAAICNIANSMGIINISEDGQIADLLSLQGVYLLARLVNVFLSTVTILVTYLIGKSLINNNTGVLAALIVAVSPISIIDSHYVTTDSSVTFFVLVSLYCAVLLRKNINFIFASMFFAGVAGAFKYPGISAILFSISSILSCSENIKKSIKYIFFGLPLAILGFLIVFPSVTIESRQFLSGVESEFFKKLSNGDNQILTNLVLYPWFLAKATGLLFILLVFISVIFNIIKIDKKSIIFLPWFVVYFLIMSSSSVALIRYADPGIPIAALLIITMMHNSFKINAPYKKIIAMLVMAAVLHLVSISSIHLYKMGNLDPRESAAFWIQKNIPTSSIIAITPSHYGDHYYTVPLDPNRYQLINLMMRHNYDASNYLKNEKINIIAANESAWRAVNKPRSHYLFWNELEENWNLSAKFYNRPFWIGLPMTGELPEDLYYIYQDVRIYSRRLD